MKTSMKGIIYLLIFCLIGEKTFSQTPAPSQYPSPMQEAIRKHERVKQDTIKGRTIVIDDWLSRPVMVYFPDGFRKNKTTDLLIHFHGSGGMVAYAAEKYKGNLVTVTINLGSGSGVYSRAFENAEDFKKLKDNIWELIEKEYGNNKKGNLILSGFSAGYGAIRSILKTAEGFEKVNTVILLDGLHASYIPERKVIAEGGLIDTVSLEPFRIFAELALNPSSGKKFLFSHSEIFPGTFVSTTECAGYLIKSLQLKAQPVLKWGPLGMQQISEVKKGNFEILGYAGNTAPDHVDHFHALYYFLNRVKK